MALQAGASVRADDRRVDRVSREHEAISGAQLGASLTGYILTYTLLLIAYLIVLTHLARKGAAVDEAHKPSSHAATAALAQKGT